MSDNYNKFVIDNGDDYICICGAQHFSMKKTFEKIPSSINPCIVNIREIFNADEIYHDSNICSWPIPDVEDRRSIISISKHYDDEIIWGHLSRGPHNSKLISSLLCGINALKKTARNYCYLYWHADKDMYMSRLPSDILNIIINFTIDKNTF
jgi:hypothetical protein